MAASSPKIRKVESIVDEIEKLHAQVARRAHEIFEKSGVMFGNDLDNWLAAETELTWKPSIELSEEDNRFVVKVAVPGVNPEDINVRVTPDDLLIKAEDRHEHREDRGAVHMCEFSSGMLFRAVHFPKKINPAKVQGEFKNGMLRLTAEVAKQGQSRKAEVQSSNAPQGVKRRVHRQ
jgi:HSP20 family protein